jgi:hypothetical protein
MKKIIDRERVESLLALAEMGKARIVKEHTDNGPVYAVFSASGTPLGTVDKRWAYMFEASLLRGGSGDGLFDGFSQTRCGSGG